MEDDIVDGADLIVTEGQFGHAAGEIVGDDLERGLVDSVSFMVKL